MHAAPTGATPPATAPTTPTITLTDYFGPDPLPMWQVQVLWLSLTQHTTLSKLHQITRISAVEISRFLDLPETRRLLTEGQSAVLNLVLDGRYGPIAIMKAASTEAAQTIVHLMRNARGEATRYKASLSILEHGGFKPPDRVEVDITRHMAQDWTSDELRAFHDTGEWPERFRHQKPVELLENVAVPVDELVPPTLPPPPRPPLPPRRLDAVYENPVDSSGYTATTQPPLERGAGNADDGALNTNTTPEAAVLTIGRRVRTPR